MIKPFNTFVKIILTKTHIYQTLALLIFSAMLLLFSNQLTAQEPSETGDMETEKPEAVVSSNTPTYRVINVRSRDAKNLNEAGLGDEITVHIENVEALISEAKKLNAKIYLTVNHRVIKDATFELADSGLSFLLRNEGDVLELWDHLMTTRNKTEFFKEAVDMSVAIEGQTEIPSIVLQKNGKGFTLIMIHKTWFWICMLFIVFLTGLFIYAAKVSDMLRVAGPDVVNGRKAFSLAKVQMAAWFLVIICTWLMLYVCLHRFNLISDGILILMGIAAGTGVGGAALDASKTLEVPLPSRNFFVDVVSDNQGVSLFRFQNFAWTLVLVIVFLRSAVVYMKMPEFDSTLLLLMGISSGTYIGAKVSEKPVTANEEVTNP